MLIRWIKSISSFIFLTAKGYKIDGLGQLGGLRFENGNFISDIRGGKGANLGKNILIKAKVRHEDNIIIGDGCILKGGPITIGKGSQLVKRVELIGPVKIGRYCAIARDTLLHGRNHLTEFPSLQGRLYTRVLGGNLPRVDKGGIEIGNDVWVGARSIILPGAKIGDGAVIGAGSVVTKNIAPYSISAGTPAVHKKYRFDQDTIKKLLELRWWDWPESKIRNNRSFFFINLHETNNPWEQIKD